jgi:hypothetical protein
MAKRKSTKGQTTIYKTKDRVKLEYQTFVLKERHLQYIADYFDHKNYFTIKCSILG